MIVIESGGTKSTWVFTDEEGRRQTLITEGLHPRELSIEKEIQVQAIIQRNDLINQEVYFFGAGCESAEAKEEIAVFLTRIGLKVRQVETDIYAACIAQLGRDSGVVGVLGTGAVAAQFDGKKIIKQTSGLGYMLGDEGSGFDIGKRLLQAYFKAELPVEVMNQIDVYFSGNSILHRIYAPDGRKVVAGLTKVIGEYRNLKEIQQILSDSFSDFCKTALQGIDNVKEVSFIGSIAYYFQDELSKALNSKGYIMKGVEKEAVFNAYSFLS